MSRSSQRTIVVVPSAPGSRVMTPEPLTVPSWRMAKRVGGSNSVIVTGSVTVIAEDADGRDLAGVPTPIGGGVIRRTDFISCIQRGWPSMSASTAQTALDRRVDDDHRLDRRRRRAIRPSAQDPIGDPGRAEPEQRSAQQPADHAAARSHRITVRHSVDARLAHLVDRPLAVAGLEVDRGDRVGQDRGLEAEADRVEGRRLDAVVGGEADDHDALDASARAGAPRARSGSVSPLTGSRIVKPGVAVLAVDALADPGRIVGHDQARVQLGAPRARDAVDRPDPAVLREMRRRLGVPVLRERRRSRRCSRAISISRLIARDDRVAAGHAQAAGRVREVVLDVDHEQGRAGRYRCMTGG